MPKAATANLEREIVFVTMVPIRFGGVVSWEFVNAVEVDFSGDIFTEDADEGEEEEDEGDPTFSTLENDEDEGDPTFSTLFF